MMRMWSLSLTLCSALALFAPTLRAADVDEPVSALPSDIPKSFRPDPAQFDFVRRNEMVAMRDGVKLRTVILIPKGAHNAPMLLTRTPYNAAERVERTNSTRLAAVVPTMDDTAVAAGYIIVFQDVRGKYGSEGDYVMTRPPRGPLNTTAVDHSTDTYDTIDWLIKHVPESNGRVGILGGSYEGFTAVVATLHPHPALKVSVPFAPMIDGWMGDDWFHNGAFRQDDSLEYIYQQEGARSGLSEWPTTQHDTYQQYLDAGSAGAMASAVGLDQLGYWRTLVKHTAYDSFWQGQALDKLLAREPISVPMMIVSGLFDQEDIYGGPALFEALAPKDTQQQIHLILGPWSHGQGRRDARGLGPLLFDGDTATWFRRSVMQPFLDYYLKDGPKPDTPRVLAYETGANQWRRYDAWPQSCVSGCPQSARLLYLQPGGRLGFERVSGGSSDAGYDEYVSDPAKPIPYRASRPTLNTDEPGSTWGEWLVDDQRNAASRPDVLVYETAPLTQPLRIAGAPYADLFASTSGTDSDWVVKLIDVWPDEVETRPLLDGYQQMLSADIFRGRFREDLSVAHPLQPNAVLPYRIRLPNANHTFLPGHRIMVQIQSSWFPLYDRNPQNFVPNIMNARPADYARATQRIWRSGDSASAIELPVIEPGT